MGKANKNCQSLDRSMLKERHLFREGAPDQELLDAQKVINGVGQFQIIEWGKPDAGNHLSSHPKRIIEFHARPQPSFNKNFDLLIANLKQNETQGYHNLVFAENPKQIERFYAIFDDLKAQVNWTPVHT